MVGMSEMKSKSTLKLRKKMMQCSYNTIVRGRCVTIKYNSITAPVVHNTNGTSEKNKDKTNPKGN